MNIPKKIHYCWFGKTPLPQDAIICINSWKKFFPNYEIIEWNEDNFDVNICDYVREAYTEKKWAFVSDYARFWVLFIYGGIYFDTDVEVIKSFDDVLKNGAFLGSEIGSKNAILRNGSNLNINPGLGMGAEKGMEMYERVLNYYNSIHFDPYKLITVCKYTTNIFIDYGYQGTLGIERICDINIYPPKYFCPMDYHTGGITLSDESHSIHRYSATWLSKKENSYRMFQEKISSKYGIDCSKKRIFKVIKNLYCYGIRGTIEKFKRKKRK